MVPPTRKRVKLNLPPMWSSPSAQADQYRAITSPKRISAMGTGTKIGKTMACACWTLEQGFAGSGRQGVWVAPFYKTAKIGFKRVRSILEKSDYLRERIRINLSTLEIQLPRDNMLRFLTGRDPDAIFGEAYDFAVVDEAARVKEASWDALLSTMTQTMGPIRLASNTDKGKRNWFYRLFLSGLDPSNPDVASWSIKTTEAPHISREAIEFMRERMSERRFRALVLAEFPDDQCSVFLNVEAIIDPCRGCRGPVLESPLVGHRYVMGVDLGRYKDFTVIVVLDLLTRRVVYFERFNRTTWQHVEERIADTSKLYWNAPGLIDATHSSMGDKVLEDLQSQGLPMDGYQISGRTKQPLIENLVLGVERARLRFPGCLTLLRAELEGYEYEITEAGNVRYAAPANGEEDDEDGDAHDDSVIALALAYWHMGQAAPLIYVPGDPRRDIHDDPEHVSGSGRLDEF